MNIVFLAPFGIRPKGTLIARMLPLAVELQARGHTVVIIAPPYTNPEDSGRVETVNGVTIRNVTLGPAGKALSAPFLAWRMYRAAMAESPALIHLFKPKGYGGLAAMLLIVLDRIGMKRAPVVIDTDDWEGMGGMNELNSYSWAERAFYQFQESWLLSRAVAVTVASRTLQTKVWGAGVVSERVLYLPNGVTDLPPGDGDAVRLKLGILDDIPVVLIYTRFFEFRQEKLHTVLGEIREQVPDVRFLVVGKGRNDEEAELIEAGEERGFGDALLMVGWLQPVDIPSYLAAADLALYPFDDTLVNRSKCPAKLTEILRAAVPVVADNVGQVAEYVKPWVSGVLCNPDTWSEMSEYAVRLLRDHDARRTFGAAGRRYLLETFSWSSYAAKLDSLYDVIIHTHITGKRN